MSAHPPENLKNRRLLRFLASPMCKLQNSASYFWYCSMSYSSGRSVWKSATYDRKQVKEYDTEFYNLHLVVYAASLHLNKCSMCGII
jgi:hypothetical protein